MADRSQDRRWIILGEDGRHVSLGRARDPSPEELDRAGAALEGQGTGGWLAILEGDYFAPRRRVRLMMVRPLTRHTGSWEEAAAAFEKIRARAAA
jgi:hypothetical protein